MRKIYSSTPDTSKTILPVEMGGLGTTSLSEASKALNAVLLSELGKPNGPALLSVNGSFPTHLLPYSYVEDDFVALYGPDSLPRLGTGVFKITNFDERTLYSIRVINGSAYVVGDTIAFCAGETVGASSLSINGTTYLVQVTSTAPQAPAILVPRQDEINVEPPVTFSSSPFSSPKVDDIHSRSDWQIATDPDFLSVAKQLSNSTTALTSWQVTDLNPSTQYYLRVRHISLNTGAGAWSPSVRFTTRAARVIIPTTITTPANGATDVNLNFTVNTTPYYAEDALDFHTTTDWEVAEDPLFATLVFSRYNQAAALTSILVSGLDYSRVYYIRARHNGNKIGQGRWSSVVTVRTINVPTLSTPSITSPATDGLVTPNTPLIASSAFAVSSGQATHTGTIYQIATDSNFQNVVQEVNLANVTQWTPPALAFDTQYYVRARYKAEPV